MSYSLYFIKGSSRQVSCVETIEAENDESAIGIAASKDWDGPLEFWDRNRFIAEFNPYGTPSAA